MQMENVFAQKISQWTKKDIVKLVTFKTVNLAKLETLTFVICVRILFKEQFLEFVDVLMENMKMKENV